MTHRKKKPDLVVGDKCRIISAPPLADCNGIRNESKCVFKGYKSHSAYVRVHKQKGLYPVYPGYLGKIKIKKESASV